MNLEDNYRDAASHALAGFQIIEASLKGYISDYHRIVREHLPKEIVYKNDRLDIENAALGVLVKTFSRMNSNTSLIEKLRELKPKRDELAHRALTNLYGANRIAFQFNEETDKLVQLANDLVQLIEKLNIEHIKLVGLKPRSNTSSNKL